jgi:hypothetical protein
MMNALRLTRASEDVGSFLSALGSLRETRLTAALGFLVARFPADFGPLLGLKITPADEISIEETDGGDRYDVLIKNSGEEHIIEGKVGLSQRSDQLLRYIKNRRKPGRPKPALTVVDEGSEFSQSRHQAFQKVRQNVRSLRFVTWNDVATACHALTRKKKNLVRDPLGTIVAQDLANHLKENHMTTEPHPEIYLRDVSDVPSVRLYFQHHIYKCQSKFYNSARGNLYFAPYFTGPTAERVSEVNLVPVGEGVSFISQVKSVQVVAKKDVLAFLKERKHKNSKEAADIIRQSVREKEIVLMLLGEPRLLFMSPVTKKKLDEKVGGFGRGAMGSRSCTLEQLLQASQ